MIWEERIEKNWDICHRILVIIPILRRSSFCFTEQEHAAGEYVKMIRDTLKLLIPVQYTENELLNILLTDKEAVMKEKGSSVEINVDNVNLDFIFR